MGPWSLGPQAMERYLCGRYHLPLPSASRTLPTASISIARKIDCAGILAFAGVSSLIHPVRSMRSMYRVLSRRQVQTEGHLGKGGVDVELSRVLVLPGPRVGCRDDKHLPRCAFLSIPRYEVDIWQGRQPMGTRILSNGRRINAWFRSNLRLPSTYL